MSYLGLSVRDSLMHLMKTYKGEILCYTLFTNTDVNLARLALSDVLPAGLQHSLFVHVPPVLHISVGNTQT
jgi:hypothetical protein